jgi:hypothetical protein
MRCQLDGAVFSHYTALIPSDPIPSGNNGYLMQVASW